MYTDERQHLKESIYYIIDNLQEADARSFEDLLHAVQREAQSSSPIQLKLANKPPTYVPPPSSNYTHLATHRISFPMGGTIKIWGKPFTLEPDSTAVILITGFFDAKAEVVLVIASLVSGQRTRTELTRNVFIPTYPSTRTQAWAGVRLLAEQLHVHIQRTLAEGKANHAGSL